MEKKALEVVSLEVKGLTSICDYFVIATGAVDVHLKAILEHIEAQLKSEGMRPLHIEGQENLRWVLMDYVDVVVHLFLPETRKFYALERLWGEAKVKYYDDEVS